MENVDNEISVVIATFDTEFQAQVAHGLLEQHGVPSVVQGMNSNVISPFFSESSGGVKLLVLECDAEVAKEILENTDGNGVYEESIPEDEVKRATDTGRGKMLVCAVLIAAALGILYLLSCF